MNWLFPRWRRGNSKPVQTKAQRKLDRLLAVEALETRVTPANLTYASGVLSLNLLGAESALTANADSSGARLLFQMAAGQKLDVSALPAGLVVSKTDSSAVINIDDATDNITVFKANYGATVSNILTLGDIKPTAALDIRLNDDSKGTNTATIAGTVDLSAKNSSFLTTSTSADSSYALGLTIQLYGQVNAGTGDIRLASKLAGKGVSNLEVSSPLSPDLKATNITIEVAGSIGFDKSGNAQPLEVQASGLISIKTSDNPAQLTSVNGPNTFSLLELGTGTATLFGDFKTNGAEVVGNATTVNLTAGSKLTLGGNETIRTLVNPAGQTTGVMDLGASNGFTLTLDTREFKAFDGIISGGSTGKLVIGGSGTQELTNANTYAGGTEVKAGATLQLANTLAAGTGDITVANGATLNLKGNIAPANKVTITGTGVGSTSLGAVRNLSGNNKLAGTLVVSGDSLVTVPTGNLTLGAITLNGNLTTYTETGSNLTLDGIVSKGTAGAGIKTTGKGAVVITKANTYDGGTQITEGTTTIQNEAALGTGGAVVSNGASLIIQGGTFNIANDLKISGSGFGGIGAIQSLAGTNNLKGKLLVDTASLVAVKTGALTISGPVTLNGDLTIQAEGGTTATVSSVIDDGANTFGLNTAGTGIVTLLNANLYDGTTTVGTGSTLVLGETTTGTITKGSIESPGVTLTAASSTFVFNRSDKEATPFEFTPIISGPGAVTVQTGAVRYITTQEYTGPTTIIANAILEVGDKKTNGWLNPLSNIVDNGKLVFQRNDTKTIENFISGIGNVWYRSTGTFTVKSDNTYSGGTTVETGTTLILAANNGAGASSGLITVQDTADLRLDGTYKVSVNVPNPINVTGQGRDNKGSLRNVTGNNTFSGGVTLASSISIGTVPSTPTVNNDLTLSGVITDGVNVFGLTVLGEGRLILTNANTYDGNTLVFQGDLVLRNGQAAGKVGTILVSSGNTLYLNPLGGGSMTLSNTINVAGTGRNGVGAIVNESGDNTINGNVYLNGNTVVTAYPATTLNLMSSLDDDTSSFQVTLQGGGTIVLGKEGLYDGGTVIKAGTTGILAANNAAGVGSILVENGATLGLRGGSTGISSVSNITVGGTGVSGKGAIQNISGNNLLTGTGLLTADTLISVAGGSRLEWSGVVDDGIGTFGLTVQDGGNLVLSANNTYGGNTTIGTATTLTLGSGGKTGALASPQVLNSGILAFQRTDLVAAPFVFNPLVTGSGSVQVKSGAVQFTSDQKYTGGTTIDAGGTLIIGDGALSGSVIGDIVDNGALWYRRSGKNPVVIDATITGTGTVDFKDTATYRLIKANNWSGVTTIDSGATVEVGDGTTGSVGAISTGFGPTATGSIVVNGALVFNSGTPLSSGSNRFVNQTLSGTGSVTYQAAGMYVVSGNNSYTGGTTISNAEAMLTSATGVGSNTVKILANGTLGLDSVAGIKLANPIQVIGNGQRNAGAIRSKSGANEFSGTVLLTGATTLSNLTSDTGSLLFSNVISGASKALTIAGPQGGVTFTANNTYSGATTIAAGASLTLGDGTGTTGAIGSSSVILNTAGTSTARLRFNRTDLQTNPFRFGASISGKGAVDILTGAVIFTGNNTFTGLTTIYLGATLIIGDGSANGTITSDILNNGLLIFDVTLASQTLPGVVIPGTISGTGDVTFRKTGPYTLTADSAYSGLTTIETGATVQVGNGGTTGSLTGNIVNDGTLIFNRSSANLTIGQKITSNGVAGSVQFKGGAVYTVTNDNSWDLGTSITGNSTVILASNTGLGTGLITVAGGSSLVLSGTSSLTVVNAISVAGTGVAGKGAIQNKSNSNILTGTVGLTADTLVGLQGGNTLKTTGAISGGFGLALAGSGTLLTTATNTYTGTTTIGSGTTLQLGENTASGSLATSGIADNGALVFNRTDPIGNPYLVAVPISGTGTVTVQTGAVQLNATNTYTGNTTISAAGTLIVGNGGTSGGIYQPDFAGSIRNDNELIFQRSDGKQASPLLINSQISGSGKVTYRSGGVFRANGANTYQGGTIIDPSTGLILGHSTAGGTGGISVANTAALMLDGNLNVANNITGGGNGLAGSTGFLQTLSGISTLGGLITLTQDSTISNLPATTLKVQGSITDGADAFKLTVTGGGRLELPGANSYDGGTVVMAGTVMLGTGASAGTGKITLQSGSGLELNSSSPFTVANLIQSAGTLSSLGANHALSGAILLTGDSGFVQDGNTITVTGSISDGAGRHGISSRGPGVLRLDGANFYDGDTLALEGTVVLSNNQSAGSGVGAVIVSKGATVLVQGDRVTIPNPWQLSGTVANSGGTNTLIGLVTLPVDAFASVDAGSTLRLTGVVTDGSVSSTLTSVGAGTLFLSGSNTFDGGLNVFAGTTSLGSSTGAGSGLITVISGTTLRLEGNGLVVGNPIHVSGGGFNFAGGLANTGGQNTLSGQITLEGDTSIGVDANLVVLKGIQETVESALTVFGDSQASLRGANSYSGNTFVHKGATLEVGDGNQSGSLLSRVVDVQNGGTVAFNRAGSFTIAQAFTGDGVVELRSTGAYTLNVDSPIFTGELAILATASGSVRSDWGQATALVSGTLSGDGEILEVDTFQGSKLLPGPGSRAQLAIEKLNPAGGAGSAVFEVYGNRQPVTNTALIGAVNTSAFNIGGLQLVVNTPEGMNQPGFVQKLVENGPGGTVSGLFVDATGTPIADGDPVPLGNSGKVAYIDYDFGPDNNDVALLMDPNLVYSLYTYNQSAGTLDIQLGENLNLQVDGDSATGLFLTLTDNLTGRAIGWVQEGGDPELDGSTVTTAKFIIPNLTALNITQLQSVVNGSNRVGFGDTNLSFANPTTSPGLGVNLPLVTGNIVFNGPAGSTIDGLAKISTANGLISSVDQLAVSFPVTFTQAVQLQAKGNVTLNDPGTLFAGSVTLTSDSGYLSSTGSLQLANTEVINSLGLSSKAAITQVSGAAILAPSVEILAQGPVSLANSGNDFNLVGVSGAGDLVVRDRNSVEFTALQGLLGKVNLGAGGKLTLPGGQVVSPGSQTYSAGANGIVVQGTGLNEFAAPGQLITFQSSSLSSSGALVIGSATTNLLVGTVQAKAQTYNSDVSSSNLVVDSLGGPVVFNGKATISSLGFAGVQAYDVSLLGGGSFDTQVNFTAGGKLVLGDAASDSFQFKGGFNAISQTGSSPVQLAGLFQTSGRPVQVQNLELTDNTTISTLLGSASGSSIRLLDVRKTGGKNLILEGATEALAGISTLAGGLVDATKGVFTFGGNSASSTAIFNLDGIMPVTQFSQVRATSVTIAQSGLGITLKDGYRPPLNGSFLLVDNQGTQPVNGTFENLPEGSLLPVGKYTFKVSYVGGDGNDIVLTNVREPSGPKVAEPFSLDAGSIVAGVGTGTLEIKSADGSIQFVQPFPGYKGSLNITTVDRTGDGIADSIAVMVAGGGAPHVVVIDAATGRIADSFYAFAPGFLGGGTLAAGLVNLNGRQESVVLIGAGPGAEPSVSVFNAYDFAFEKAFYAYAQKYTGGVTVGVTSPDPTGSSLIITGSAINSHVVLFDINAPANALASWYAFAPSTLLQQMTVAGGDLNGDGFSEVLVGAATGWPASIAVFNVRTLVNPNSPNRYAAEKAFYAFPPNSPNFNTGVRVGVSDVNKDSKLDVLAGSGPNVSGMLNAIDYETLDYLFSDPIPTLQGVTVASNLTTAKPV